MKEIKLSQNKFTTLDDEDYNKFSSYNFHYHKKSKDLSGYAVCSSPPYRSKKLHRLIINAKRGEIVDHINRDTLDNRRINLRIVNPSESSRNRTSRNKYKFHGVGRTINNKGIPTYWIARITVDGKRKYLGTFKTAKSAAKAYNDALDRFHNGIGPRNKI